MKIIMAEFYNNENALHTVDAYEYTDELNYETVLDFIEFTKKQMGHDVVKRNKVSILFTDGIRLVLRDDELVHMADVEQYVAITKNITPEIEEILPNE